MGIKRSKLVSHGFLNNMTHSYDNSYFFILVISGLKVLLFGPGPLSDIFCLDVYMHLYLGQADVQLKVKLS